MKAPTDEEFANVARLPTLRKLIIDGECELTEFALEVVSSHRNLDALWIWEAEVTAEALTAFERLSPWLCLIIDSQTCEEAWAAFRQRKHARFLALSPLERRQGAIRYLRTWHVPPPHPDGIVKSIRVDFPGFSSDDELDMLTHIKEIEALHLVSVNVTTTGLHHLAQLPDLMELKIKQCPITSLTPLAECSGLKVLNVDLYETGSPLGDVGTAGLERLTTLRQLTLDWCEIGEGTIRRLAGLRQLQSLTLDLWGVSVEQITFSVLRDLTELEHLHLKTWWWTTSFQFLEPLQKLQSLTLHVLGGDEGEYRRLWALQALRELHLSGDGVTEEGIRTLTAGLANLRKLALSKTAVSEEGAKIIAQRMPDVAITLDGQAIRASIEHSINDEVG